MPDTLITAAEALNGVRVDSLRPHTGLLEAHRELELIDHVAAAGDNAAKLQVLVDEAPQGAAGELVRGAAQLRRRDCSAVVGSPGAPETRLTPRRGCRSSTPLRWTLPPTGCRRCGAIWTPRWSPRRWATRDTAVMLGRPGGPAFRPSEVARLGYLAGIVATLLH